MASQDANAAANRPKRVRTGCLTCRARHLKCDEGKPDCMNCKKSNRTCKRGFRLNFIEIKVQNPAIILRDKDFRVHFQDESREIASEYAGGIDRYPKLIEKKKSHNSYSQHQSQGSLSSMTATSGIAGTQLPSMRPFLSSSSSTSVSPAPSIHSNLDRMTPSSIDRQTPTLSTPYSSTYRMTPPAPPMPSVNPQLPISGSPVASRQSESPVASKQQTTVLTAADQTFIMQVFVEEVGIWMDSLDPHKHFSRLLPFKALDEPMLLNALLACGAQHLALINPQHSKEKARSYIDVATRHLLVEMQKQSTGNCDTVMCATTSVILNVYDIMCGTPRERMNHVKGARTLVKACNWNANSGGVGAACFWLNTTIELLTALHLNMRLTDDPDAWGVDMDFTKPTPQGREEIWAYRIINILAKVSNYRVDMTEGRYVPGAQAYDEWKRLKELCTAWDASAPRSMKPLAYLNTFQTSGKSVFPEVWIIKRCAIVARLFYHTALILLSQIKPLPGDSMDRELLAMAQENSSMVCGITAHVKDRGVASVAIRSLAIASEVLTDRREQQEVLTIFQRINRETGWSVNFIANGLKVKWGWEQPPGNRSMLNTPSTAAPLNKPSIPITPITPQTFPHMSMNLPATSTPPQPQHNLYEFTSQAYTNKSSYEPTSSLAPAMNTLPSSGPPVPQPMNPSQYMPRHQQQHLQLQTRGMGHGAVDMYANHNYMSSPTPLGSSPSAGMGRMGW